MAEKTKKKGKKEFKEEFLVELGMSEFERAVNFRTEKISERWKTDSDLYNSRFSDEERKKSEVLVGQGRLFIPKTYSHIQRILVDILDTYFFDPEEIVDVTNWKNIPAETRMIVKSLLNYRLNGHPIDFYKEAYEAALDAMKAKVGIMKTYPKFDSQGNYTPIIETIPYEDVFFSPAATWKDYHRHTIIHRMVRSLDYLKRRGYKNLDMIQPIKDETLGDDIKQKRAEEQGSPFMSEAAVKVDSAARVLIYEIWTLLDVDGDGLLESCSYVMAGDEGGPKIVIREVQENDLPYMVDGDDYNRPPFDVGLALPESHQLYGKSLPEIVEGLQRETNVLRNQRREAVALALRKPILAQRSAGIDLVSLVNRRIGSVVLGDDISTASIRELEIKDPTGTSVQEQMRTDQDFYEATSIPPNLMGISSGPEETATSVVRHEQNANKKISQIIRNLSNTLFLPVFRKLLRLEQTYCDDRFIELVTGRVLGWRFADDGAPPREIIQGDFDLKVTSGMSKQTQINRILLIMDRANIANQTTAQMLTAGVIGRDQARFIDVSYILNRLMRLLGEKNMDDFLLEAKEPPREAQKVPGIASQPSLDTGGQDMNAIMEAMGI